MNLTLNFYPKATHTLLIGLSLALTTLSAQATSPAKPTHLVNTQTVSYTAADYQPQESSRMFPAPDNGLVQHILTLPKLENEADYRIEIAIGRSEQVDCNKHNLKGEIAQHTVQGWGYNYYQVDAIVPGPSTMMACFDEAKKTTFLTLPQRLNLEYDSRLPMVFYLPEGAQLRYRVWHAMGDYQYSEAK